MKHFLLISMLLISAIVLGAGGDIDVVRLRSADHTKIWDMPLTSDRLVGKTTVDTLKNKSISGLENTLSNIDLAAVVTGILPVSSGGTGSSTKSFVDTSTAQLINGQKTFGSTIVGSINGNASTVTTIPSLSGDVTNSGNAVTVNNSAVLGKVLTGFTAGASTVVATDSILQAIQKLAGNISGVTSFSNLTGAVTSVGPATSLGSFSSANLAGAITDETGTLKAVFSDAPTFTTNLTAPLLIGGTTVTSSLTYKTTTGVGTTGADHIFQVGSNGGTEAMRILNNGAVGIGVAAPNSNAIVDITSTTKAFMPPRMTTTQKNAISSPTAGMQVYDSTLNALNVYNGTGWLNITSQVASTSNATDFSAQVDNTGVVSGETLDWINGNCTNANPTVCTFNTSIFTVAPNCTTTITNTANNLALTAPATSTSTTATIQQNSSLVATREAFVIHCQKQGADYTAAVSNGTVATNLVGYVQTPGVSSGTLSTFTFSYGTTNSTTVCSGTPCSYLDQIGTEVSSVTRSGAGAYTVNLARTYTKLKCTVNGSLAGTTPGTFVAMSCASCNSIGISSYNIDAAPVAAANTYGTVMCQGTY